MALTIGLTGGIATGKSTVSNLFKNLNIPVVDADIISRKVVEPGRQAYVDIVETFGDRILQHDLTINRKALGQIIFTDELERHRLNNIVHPAVRKEMLKQRTEHMTSGALTIVLDIPLLFESELTHLVDKVLVVYLDAETQLNRLLKRDEINADEAEKRIQSQMSIEQKIKQADATINNNGSIEQTKKQLLNLLEMWDVQ